MNSISKLKKNTVVYISYDLLQKGRGLILLPLFTRYLTPGEYGTVVMVTSLAGVLLSFTGILMQANSRFYFDSNDEAYIERLWGTNITFMTFISLAIPLFFVLFGDVIFKHTLKGVAFYPYILLGLLSIPTMSLINIYQDLLKTQQQGFRFAVFGLSIQILNIILIVLVLTVWNMKINGILLSIVFVNTVGFIYAFFVFYKKVKWGIDKALFKKSFKYSLQYFPHTIAGLVFALLDRFFLTNMRSTYDTGIYHVGVSLGLMLNIVTAGFNQAFSPFCMSKIGEKSNHKEITMIASFAVFFYVCAGIGISLYSKDAIALLASAQYTAAWLIAPIFVLSNLFEGIYRIVVLPLFYDLKGPKYVSMITFGASGINIVVLYFMILYFGTAGAALTSLIISVISTISIGFFANKIHRINWDYAIIIKTIAGGIVFTVAILAITETYGHKYYYPYYLLMKTALYLLSIVLLILICGYNLNNLKNRFKFFIQLKSKRL